jgi:hypothetical protein
MRAFLFAILVLAMMAAAVSPRQALAQKLTDSEKISVATALTPQTGVSATSTTTRATGSLFPNMIKGMTGSGSNTATGGNAKGPTGGDPNNPQTMLGQEWRIKRSHERGSFVGADTSDKTGFVGAEQALEEGEGQVTSAVEGLRLNSNAAVNLPLPIRRKTDIYDPTVQVDFAVTRPTPGALSSTVTQHLASVVSLRLLIPIEVSVEGRTAILRGEVASERDRVLAERLALFEPGIDGVRNQLQVKTVSQTPQRP